MHDLTPGDRHPGDDASHQGRVAALIDRWLDNAITPPEIAEMEATLMESSAARREFWRRAGLHGLLHEAARVKFAAVPNDTAGGGAVTDRGSRSGGSVPGAVRPRRLTRERIRGWLRADVAAACCLLVAVGGGIGSFVTSRAAASAGRNVAEESGPIVVVDEGFEAPPAPAEGYLPGTLDCWSGDETRVVGHEAWATIGMLPHSGTSMLRFVSGHPRNASYPGVASEIWRFVDLDELRAIAGSKDIRVELSAWFNSVEPGEGRRPVCGLRAVATHLGPGEVNDTMWINSGLLEKMDAPSERAPPVAAAAKTEDRFDADVASWQQLTVVLSLPPGSPRYLLVHCYALDRSEAAASGDRLPGQYVDDLSLTVEPADASRAARAKTLPFRR